MFFFEMVRGARDLVPAIGLDAGALGRDREMSRQIQDGRAPKRNGHKRKNLASEEPERKHSSRYHTRRHLDNKVMAPGSRRKIHKVVTFRDRTRLLRKPHEALLRSTYPESRCFLNFRLGRPFSSRATRVFCAFQERNARVVGQLSFQAAVSSTRLSRQAVVQFFQVCRQQPLWGA